MNTSVWLAARGNKKTGGRLPASFFGSAICWTAVFLLVRRKMIRVDGPMDQGVSPVLPSSVS